MIYIYCMLVTAIVETIFFWCCKYRKVDFLTYVFFLNLATNFVVNQFFRHLYTIYADYKYTLIFILELGVYISEVLALSLFEGKFSKRLCLLVFLANFITPSSPTIFSLCRIKYIRFL